MVNDLKTVGVLGARKGADVAEKLAVYFVSYILWQVTKAKRCKRRKGRRFA
jgi:hypothetical protein